MFCVTDVFVKFSPSKMRYHYDMILEQKYLYSYIEYGAAHLFPAIYQLLVFRGIKYVRFDIHTYITTCQQVLILHAFLFCCRNTPLHDEAMLTYIRCQNVHIYTNRFRSVNLSTGIHVA